MVNSAHQADRGGRWLRTLTGSGVHAPASHPPLIAQSIDAFGPGAFDWAVDLGHRMAVTIIAEIPEFGGGEEAFQTLRMGTESAILRAMLLLVSEDSAAITGAGREALEGDRDFVRRGIPLDLVLRGIRIGHAMMSRALLGAAAISVEEPLRTSEIQRVSELLFEYIDHFSSSMATEYLTEHDRWVTSAAAERAELVRTILDGHAVAVDQASRTLGYPLARYHLALVLWHAPGSPATPSHLQRTASHMLADSGCGATLVVPHGASSLWAWASWRSKPAQLPKLAVPTEPGTHVMAGTLATGMAGFRQSHREAQRAAEMVRSTATSEMTGATVTWYADVELAVLLGQDLELARMFVARELGTLSFDTPSAAELRETLAVYLSCDRSLAKAAEILHVARNTVAYRVKKVENSTGRDLRDRRLELECALRLAATLGPQVLTREE
ncbi:PucR family transcriptional regulator [Actinomadura opuntiae]|uniref:PucR family transcriptional regulator n=1 Tax=Actinomadura sp. OS1-43 TaxID=604315 RepID=UPI00255AE84B|nr:helix-turn-helix domain-containing protein [Actinomadura sp. OS1-43]MDL4818519.1 helix-turn-helix domain-containing protein [Actinomadura sp. OS1-43]